LIATPKKIGVEDVYATGVFLHGFIHVLRASRPIPAFAVPQTNKADLIGPPGESGVQLPQIVPSIRVGFFRGWTELIGHHKQPVLGLLYW
jgi:hypothetical protein